MLRAAVNLFGLWDLTDKQAVTLLGVRLRSYSRWKAGGKAGSWPRDLKARLSNLMGVHKALEDHLSRPAARLRLDPRRKQRLREQVRPRGHAGRRTDRSHACPPLPRRRARRLVTIAKIRWSKAAWIIRSLYPPIDLFEDVADPADWPLLIAAEQKTNPRLADEIGALDLVPPQRRVGGQGASYLMAPFTHASPDRPSRFTVGLPGVLYAGDLFEVALAETIFHHGALHGQNEGIAWMDVAVS